MTLSLYFARRFAVLLALTAGALLLLLGLVEVIERLRDLSGQEGTGAAALRLTLLSLPRALHEVMPLVTLLATLWFFLGLARSSELVVARAAGRSALATLRAPVAVILLVGGLLVAALNPIVAATERRLETLETRLTGLGEVLSISEEGLWLRQSDGAGQTVIRAAGASLDGTELTGASFFTYAPGEGPVRRIDAARAHLAPGTWQIEDAAVWDLTLTNPEAAMRREASLGLPTDLTAERILDGFGEPLAVPIWDLPRFIAQLERAGFAARAHRMHLWSEIASPLFLAAMVVLGAAFTMRHARGGRTGLMVGAALGGGFGLYFLKNFAAILGTSGQVPIPLAALSPVLAAAALGLALVLHLEDG